MTFFTHIRLMLRMMPPPLSFFFFSSSRLSPTATARLRDEWWVDSLFLLLWLPRRDFCSLFLLLWLSLGISAGFPAKRDLLEKILENWNLKLWDMNPQSSSLFTIEKFLPGIEPGSAPLSCLWCIYCKSALMQTWNQRLVALDST